MEEGTGILIIYFVYFVFVKFIIFELLWTRARYLTVLKLNLFIIEFVTHGRVPGLMFFIVEYFCDI